MSPAPAVISVSPHPDDEIVGAGATLLELRDAGWRVVNLACSLGRPPDRIRRRAELVEACRIARFELVIAPGMPPIGSGDDLAVAQTALSTAITDLRRQSGAQLIVGPSPHDGHHGHEVVGRAIRDAVEAGGEPLDVMFWGLWSDLPVPNVLVEFGAARLHELQDALGAHARELARNRLDRLVESRATANALLGAERVFGFGLPGAQCEYAELLTLVSWRPERGWRLPRSRSFDPSSPTAEGEGPDIGWWLHAPSVRSSLRRE
ncbi:MAG TPA: PIG-L family deacetylase [Solirubrobacteraceae bacterium]|jgi:LmbE family N-acetylglucosaminyl deacetylase